MCLAIPGKVISLKHAEDAIMTSGKVEIGGIKKEVNFSMVPEAKIGDYVLIHVGLAISIIDEEEAQKTLQYLEDLGELNEIKKPEI